MPTFILAATVLATLAFSAVSVSAFDSAASDNLAVYWGQGSGQKPLAAFCNDDTIDIIPIGFVDVFPDQAGSNGFPGTNFANACGGAYYTTLGGVTTQLLASCPGIEADIKTCQSNGKKILLSLGGGAATAAYIASDISAIAFADFLWGAFGPVTDAWTLAGGPRPFGDAVVDGFDFDIESLAADIPTAVDFGYATMANHFRSLFDSWITKPFYLSAAPQCIVPDGHLADCISKAVFDFIFVQFYNTPQCSARAHFDSTYGQAANGGVPTDISYDSWITWILGNAANKATKVFIGLPASTLAADSADYLTPGEAQTLIADFQCKYPANFGGIMLWEATYSDNNQINGQSYAQVIKPLLTGNSCGLPTTTSSTTSSTTSTTTSSPTSSTTSSTSSTWTTSSTTSTTTSSPTSSTTSSISSTWTTSSTTTSSSTTSSTTSSTSSLTSSTWTTSTTTTSSTATSSPTSSTTSSTSSTGTTSYSSTTSPTSSISMPVGGVTTSSPTSSASTTSSVSTSSCGWGSACSTGSSSTPVYGVTTSSSTSSTSSITSSSPTSTPTGWSTFGTCTSSTCKGLATGPGTPAGPAATSSSGTSSTTPVATWASWSADPSTPSTLTSTWTFVRPTSTSTSSLTTSASTTVVPVITMTIVPVPSSVWYASTYSRPSSVPIPSLSLAPTASALPSAPSSSSSTLKSATGANVSSWLPASLASAATPSTVAPKLSSTATPVLPALTMTTVSVAQGATWLSDPSLTLSTNTNSVQATQAAPFATFTGAASRSQVSGGKAMWVVVVMGVLGLVGPLV